MEGADLELFERSVGAAAERAKGIELDAALAELGWLDALDDDPQAAVGTLFALQGEHNVTSSALSWLIAATLGAAPSAVVLPSLGQWRVPGALVPEGVEVHGLIAATPAEDDNLLVVVRSDDKDSAVVINRSALDLRPIGGIDPRFGLVEVDGRAAAGEQQPVDWPAAVAVAQRALSHELIGAARKILDLAREHALERIQFGRPIAMFQAVRHRLAETLVAIESADAALGAAWDDGSAQSSAMAKAVAGRAARTASRHGQQVLAGIGFTTEHDLHRYIRRVIVLDQLFGSARSLTAELGREVLAARSLPPPLPL